MLQLCVPMVLQTFHMLASTPKLKAVAMRLMTALWKKQVCQSTLRPNVSSSCVVLSFSTHTCFFV